MLSISHSIASGRPLSLCYLVAVIGYIAQFLFIPLIDNFSLKYYRFIVAISLLFAKTRTTASDMSGCPMILCNYLAASSTL